MNNLQSKMARVGLGWGVRDLAAQAGVAPDTIARLERGEELKDSTLKTIRIALERAGVAFVDDSPTRTGVLVPRAE